MDFFGDLTKGAQNFMDAKKKGHISDTRDFGVMPVCGSCKVDVTCQ